MGSFDVHKV
jgi:hypothetical protein